MSLKSLQSSGMSGYFQAYKRELHEHMFAEKLKKLRLDESNKIGYTYKTLGAGFWALKQNDFRQAITDVTMEVCIGSNCS